MTLFDDDEPRVGRTGGAWAEHRAHRDPRSGPAQDEVAVLALSSFLLARTDEVVVAVSGISAHSDGLLVSVAVLFADEQKAEDLGWAMQVVNRSPGRFRLGCRFSDGRTVATGTRIAVVPQASEGPVLLLLDAQAAPLKWSGTYWLHPVPPPGPVVLGCQWPDRAIPETLVEIDPQPLIAAAATAGPVWRAQ